MGMSLKFFSEGFVVTRGSNLHGQVHFKMTTALRELRDRIVNREKKTPSMLFSWAAVN